MWEERPEDWPDDEPWVEEAEVARHDLAERTWLAPAHRAALDAGTLDLPDRVNDHPSVLVSIPYRAAGTHVAWVDRDVAEVVFHSARLGVPTVESCEAADPGYGWRGGPTLFFDNYRTFKRFRRLVGPVSSPDWFNGQNTSRAERLLRFAGRSYPVEIPPEDLPRLTAYLRDL